jgi:uncharacterized protein
LIDALTALFAPVFATEGLMTLLVAVFAAGLVRGFTGFGTAMVYMPFAGTVLSPVWALITLLIYDMIGPLPNVPRALRDGAPRDVARLGIGALIGLPVGLLLIYRIDPVIFRWLVSVSSLVLLVLLMSGWRYSGELARWKVFATGILGGLLGGVSGLAGPPVIMLYMASRRAVQTIRANILLYLLLVDVLALGIMAVSDRLSLTPLLIGLFLAVPYMLANVIGGLLFRPDRERIYRVFAYVLIAVSAIMNLPLFG